jgi:hypothetical protein
MIELRFELNEKILEVHPRISAITCSKQAVVDSSDMSRWRNVCSTQEYKNQLKWVKGKGKKRESFYWKI